MWMVRGGRRLLQTFYRLLEKVEQLGGFHRAEEELGTIVQAPDYVRRRNTVKVPMLIVTCYALISSPLFAQVLGSSTTLSDNLVLAAAVAVKSVPFTRDGVAERPSVT